MVDEEIELQSNIATLHQTRRSIDVQGDEQSRLNGSFHPSDSSSGEDDLDELDPLNENHKSKRRRRRDGQSRDGTILVAPSRSGAWSFTLSRFHCFLIFLFFACTSLILAAGSFWAYTYKPPPIASSRVWDPAPLGGSDNAWAESYAKAAKLVAQMTLAEKVNITTGIGWKMGMCVGNTGSIPRLGFPSLCLQDGPLGIRYADNITAFPAGVTTGSTWDKELSFQRGKAHGREAKLKGINVLLGPAVGPLGRSPLGGRNWETFGTDPVLQGLMAAEDIKGIQEEGVMATVKHFIGNEQEHFRQAGEWKTPWAISSDIGERALRELYAWPFAEAVRAGVASVMCSYNRVNGSYACGDDRLLNRILKDEIGFQGFVVSDWLAQREGVPSALGGLDMTMPGDGLVWEGGDSLWGSDLTIAVLNGAVPLERLNDMVTRIVAAWYQLGQDDAVNWSEKGPNFSSWTNETIGLLHAGSDDLSTGIVNHFVNAAGEGPDAHKHLVRKIAAAGTVLVKNEDGLLPLNRTGGTPKVKGKFKVGIYGEDSRNDPKGVNECIDRGCNEGTLGQGWGSGSVDYPYLVAPDQAIEEAFDLDKVDLVKASVQKISSRKDVADLHNRDLCLVFANADSGEGYISPVDQTAGDRNNLTLSKRGGQLIQQVASACGGDGSSPTVVILHTVGPVLVEQWIYMPGVKAVLFAMLPGQESGNAIVDVLFGDVNPSGRLPWTVGKSEKDYGPSFKIMDQAYVLKPSQTFDEGLYIDYRHFDKYGIVPRFEFGFGLSYTTFALSSLSIEPKASFIQRKHELSSAESAAASPPTYNTTIPNPSEALFPVGFRKLKKYIYPYISTIADVVPSNGTRIVRSNETLPASANGHQGGHPGLYEVYAEVSALVANTGHVTGSAVIQLYVGFPSDYSDPDSGEKVDFPVKVLRNFQKIYLEASDRQAEVRMPLTRKDLSYWCERRRNWVMPEKGTFTIMLGFSSRNIPKGMEGPLG